MGDRSQPEALILGFSPEARELMRQSAPIRQARREQEVQMAIDQMTIENAVQMLESVRHRTWFYFDRDLAKADLKRAVERYREVTGRRAPRRLAQLA